MNLKEVFISRGQLKPLWRVIVFFFLAFVLLHFLTLILWEQALVRYIILFFVLIGLSLVCVRYIDKRSPATIGFMFHSRWLKEYGVGVLTGFICVSILFVFLWGTGFIEVAFIRITPALLTNIFILSLLTTLFQSAFEELLFRGYLYQNLILGTNTVLATAVLSLLSGLGHLLTPHARWTTAVNLTVFGVLHSLAYLKTRTLWLASGLHFGWNFFMRNIYSLPVSGTKAESCLLNIQTSGPFWLTGGEYGPEAGLPALLVLTAACFFVFLSRKMEIHPEMSGLWKNINT